MNAATANPSRRLPADAATAAPMTARPEAIRSRRAAAGLHGSPSAAKSRPGGREANRRQAVATASSVMTKAASPPATSDQPGCRLPPNATAEPPATERSQASPSRPRSTADQVGPTATPSSTPPAAATAATSVNRAESLRGPNPTAARVPISSTCVVTRSDIKSHNSSSPAATRNIDSAMNSPPKGVEPLDAARAASRNGTTASPIACGRIAAARSARRLSRSSIESRGRCQAVVWPNRLAASRLAVAIPTKALGVAAYVFQ